MVFVIMLSGKWLFNSYQHYLFWLIWLFLDYFLFLKSFVALVIDTTKKNSLRGHGKGVVKTPFAIPHNLTIFISKTQHARKKNLPFWHDLTSMSCLTMLSSLKWLEIISVCVLTESTVLIIVFQIVNCLSLEYS